MTAPPGRHRIEGRSTGLLLVGGLILLGLGFVGGVITSELTGSSAEGGTSPGTAVTAGPSDTPSPTAVPSVEPSLPTNSAAPPDPGPEAGDAVAFLEAVEEAGVPIGPHQELLLALGSGVCHAPPEARADPAATAQHIHAVLGDIWSLDQATRIVQAIDETLC